MSYTKPTLKLTDSALTAMIEAARAKASEIGQPQCIVIVDASAAVLAQFRMEGAKVLSLRSAEAKAQTAAVNGKPSDAVPEAMRAGLAFATQGAVTGLKGGLPIRFDGQTVGGIGIGSGTGDQDVAVAQAALAAIGAEAF